MESGLGRDIREPSCLSESCDTRMSSQRERSLSLQLCAVLSGCHRPKKHRQVEPIIDSTTCRNSAYKIEQRNNNFLGGWRHTRNRGHLVLVVVELDLLARHLVCFRTTEGSHPFGAGPHRTSNILRMRRVHRVLARTPSTNGKLIRTTI